MVKITGCVVSFFKSIFHIDTMAKIKMFMIVFDNGCTFYDGKFYFVDEKGIVFTLDKKVTFT